MKAIIRLTGVMGEIMSNTEIKQPQDGLSEGPLLDAAGSGAALPTDWPIKMLLLGAALAMAFVVLLTTHDGVPRQIPQIIFLLAVAWRAGLAARRRERNRRCVPYMIVCWGFPLVWEIFEVMVVQLRHALGW